jgi:glycosyltransferase involved in cell wall biosynthesis
MMSEPLVSVVMVVCNVDRFLAESIESILGQTFKDFEFIIVDFGSTDKSKAIALNYAARDARIKLHEIPNCGLGEARNAGCFLAQGRYIAVMDADDISTPDRLMSEFEFMEKHRDVGLLGGYTEWIDETGGPLRIERFPAEDHEIRSAFVSGCPFCQPTVLMRREAFVLVGGYRAAFVFAEDYDLWLRIAEHFPCANLRQVVLKYRSHPYQVQIRKSRQQSLCILAALTSASLRKAGKPDPFNSVKEITPAVLASMGVSEAKQQIFADLAWIRALYRSGDYSNALKSSIEALGSCNWECAESWQIAETRLMVARLNWKKKRYASSILTAGHAFVSRPIMLGRPFKPLLRWFGWLKPANGRN